MPNILTLEFEVRRIDSLKEKFKILPIKQLNHIIDEAISTFAKTLTVSYDFMKVNFIRNHDQFIMGFKIDLLNLSDTDLKLLQSNKIVYLDPFWTVLQKYNLLTHVMLLKSSIEPTPKTTFLTLNTTLFSEALSVRKNERDALGNLTEVIFRQSPK